MTNENTISVDETESVVPIGSKEFVRRARSKLKLLCSPEKSSDKFKSLWAQKSGKAWKAGVDIYGHLTAVAMMQGTRHGRWMRHIITLHAIKMLRKLEAPNEKLCNPAVSGRGAQPKETNDK